MLEKAFGGSTVQGGGVQKRCSRKRRCGGVTNEGDTNEGDTNEGVTNDEVVKPGTGSLGDDGRDPVVGVVGAHAHLGDVGSGVR